MRIYYTPKFARAYRKLPDGIKRLAEKQEKVFRNNPFDPSLKTHKLHGRLAEFWSFSIGLKYRIVFEFAANQLIYFHDVGAHDVYQ